MENEIKSIKVAFVQKVGDDQYETETMWCDIVDNNNYKIANIPAIVKNVSLGDIIEVEYDIDEERYYFENLVLASGNSTVHILVYRDEDVDPVKIWLEDNKCESKILRQRNIVAVNIPKQINYSPIKKYLDQGEEKEIWTYEESCLEHDY
ncbi:MULTISPECIES: DUF4265 domain-containing protein [Chryseobacterium]|uniref:DUF4265 domain-containing protein n=1 Tax=Chryseobacterium camelliae TaxID=1265445 RepID=A0ABU0TMZ2_9FLAO|nr:MULTISPECIES: DUF4265 domain-containing protein [Chryseobacterium]MDT3408474.1 hypothetical protein [Pseudacidovorax intermedius]MDQ1097670.1 hypothetical protein [Chryseobacterium camelliae]MDQ1101599.1 hypothetical protein [Chryseobacterium sp. SORGH_AS_1048]MDR6085042.1 hypothetical protein [Chryseobacterium sp. SORGH_AS_0909]MDR6129397.1 hypothetical protein [Chryseobacterium sp. SORGH_AS_1175]